MEIKSLDFPFEIKEIDNDEGKFAGYASVFDQEDAYKEIMLKGSFEKSLRSRKPAMLWQHQRSEPIGLWLEVREDDRGLPVVGQLALDVQRAKEARSLMSMKAVKGLSIGFRPVVSEYDRKTEVLKHKEVELWEISIVTFPALQSANVDRVKSFFGETLPTERDVEAYLREAGLSKNQAMAFISRGYKAVMRDAITEKAEECEVREELAESITNLLRAMRNGN